MGFNSLSNTTVDIQTYQSNTVLPLSDEKFEIVILLA
jgi:hypothetical protein